MSFVAAMSISTYLLLFAFLSLGCSQDDSNIFDIEDVPVSTSGSPFSTRPTVKPHYTRLRRRQAVIQDYCLVPPQPANGVRRQFVNDLRGGIEFRDPTAGDEIAAATLLNYICDSGYKVNGNPLVVCGSDGNWSHIPECIQVKCEPLNSASTTAKCFRLGEWADCDSSLLQGTQARVSCRPGYSHEMSSTMFRNETVECNKDGKWEPNPIECVPVCGRVINETTGRSPWYASIYSQYSDGGRKKFRCGATVVRNDLVLTAASCVYNDETNPTVDPKRLLVMAGHRFRKWDYAYHDFKFVQKRLVKAVHMNCDYHGRHTVADIALVEIEEPFEFSSSIIPACLDDRSSNVAFLQSEAWGSVAEFGPTVIVGGRFGNDILLPRIVHHAPYSQCNTSDLIIFREDQLTTNEYCSRDHNRSCIGVHEHGGGLMFKREDSWYVIGIVRTNSYFTTPKTCDFFRYGNYTISHPLSENGRRCFVTINNSHHSCERYASYTNISEYTTWMHEVLFNLDRYKSNPRCNSTRSLNHVTITPQIPLDNQNHVKDDEPACSAPPQPANGEWRFDQSLCLDKADCETLKGAPLRPGTVLIYRCDPGYMAKGSTEVYCGFSGKWSTIPHCTGQVPLNNQNLPNDEEPACSAPPQPANGEWRFDQSLCLDKADCETLKGAPLRPGTLLIYRCDPGYMAEGSTEVYCGFSGKWSTIPLCTEIKCDSLNSVSTTVRCYGRSGEWVSCVSPIRPRTVAEISCQPGYRKDTTFPTWKVVECSERGEWTRDPIRCVPVCGVPVTHGTAFISNGAPTRLSDFPWHATLYMQENSSKGITTNFKCGATIIQMNFVLTAAHCVYDEGTRTTADPDKLFVMTGNIFRDYDSPLHNPLSVKKTAVKNVYRPCKYYGLRGNYASDIALLELQTPFQFSSILRPACLDVEGHSDRILEPGVYGKVAGFGRTETGDSSGVLQTLTLPYISYNECKTSKNADKNDVFISKDKFCAGYTNGSAVCEGDSGGGLVFRKRGLWYVMGIVSLGLGVNFDNGEKTCDRYDYSLYTKVSEYMSWIQEVMFQRDHDKPYPPCDADI